MPDPSSPSQSDPGAEAGASESIRPGTHPSAPQYAVELPYPEELQTMLGGAYVVEGFLGQGGMGAVYKGLQMPLKRPVAIKILARGVGLDYGFEERFKREAYAMAALTHPHIVRVYDCGDAGENFLFISMEMVEGGDLSDALKNKKVTPELALKLMPQICDGLQAAHERGIIHRDIKPANIFLTKDGRAKVADFGLAKKLDTTGTMVTKTGLGLGTPDYAAPEQYDNMPDIDHRADIYSLGVMMYQLLTGSIPRGSWKAPSTRAPVDPRLDDVVLKALASDRDDRYQTVAELKADIVSITMPPLTTGTIPMARAASASSSAAIASGQTGVIPAYTGPVPIPTRTSPMPVRPSPPGPSTKATAVPAARSTGPVAQPRPTTSVPAKPQAAPVQRAATSSASVPRAATRSAPVPVKKEGLPMGLVAVIVCVVLGVGAWFFLKGGSGGGGRVVHLLDLSNPKGEALRGIWTATPAGLNGRTPPPQPGLKDDDRMPVFELNYTPPEEYDFEIEFSRTGGSIVQILSSGGTAFAHEYTPGPDNGTAKAGLTQVDGKSINGTNEGNAIIPTSLTSRDARHVSVVEVRRNSVRSRLDGKEIIRWTGDFSRLSLANGFRLSSSNGHLGLASWSGDVTFYRADVREISGAGEVTTAPTLAGTGGGGKMSASDVKPLVEWLVPLKGFLTVQVGTINRKVVSVEELPASFDRVVEVDVPGGPRPGNFRVPADLMSMIKSYKEMKRIALRNCQVNSKDIAPLVADKPQLTNLGIGGNHIDDTIIESLLRLPLLEAVDLSYNKEFTGRGLERLAVLSKLSNVVVNDSNLSDEGLASLAKLPGIKVFSLTNTKVTDAGLMALPPLPILDNIGLRFTPVTMRGLLGIRSAPKLRRIELSLGRGINEVGELAALKELPNLQELVFDMSGPNEKQNIAQLAHLGELAPLPVLKRFEQWGSYSLQGPPLGGLDQLPRLEYLGINAAFTDDDVALLKPLKLLRLLRLNSAQLTENGALKLTPFASLQEINRKAFTEAGLKAFKEYRPDVRIVE